MSRPVRLLLSVATLLATAAALAGGSRSLPSRYARNLDHTPVVAQDPSTGNTWTAWAYRNGAEYDIAISVLQTDGTWSEPEFIGLDSGFDEVEPSLVIDGKGMVLLAFATRESGTVQFASRPADMGWSVPTTLSGDGEQAAAPQLTIVADRLVLGYRAGLDVVIRELGLVTPIPQNRGGGIDEGPDVVDPLGWTVGDPADGDEDGSEFSDGTMPDGNDTGAVERFRPTSERGEQR